MPALDPTLLGILNNRPQLGSVQQSAFQIADAMAKHHLMELAHEQDMVERAKREGDERAQRNAVQSPYVRGLIKSAVEPVGQYNPDAPSSYAPGTVGDVNTIQSALPPMGGPNGIPRTGAPSPAGAAQTPSPFDNVPVQDLRGRSRDPNSVIDLTRAFPTEIGPDLSERKLDQQPSPYSEQSSAFNPQDLSRRSLPNRAQDQLRRQPGEDGMPRTAEEFTAGKDLLKQVGQRRNTEETSRRQLQVEDLRGKSKARDSQLNAATKLLVNLRDNATKMAVEVERAKAIMAKKSKTGQDLKALKDGWNLAREHADAAKSAVAMLYQAGAAGAAEGTPEFTNYQEALKESRRALNIAGEWERAYTDATNGVKDEPKVGPAAPKTGGKAVPHHLDANGDLVPG